MPNPSNFPVGQDPTQAGAGDDTPVTTYHYLRVTLVVLLLGLGAAVVYQTWYQGWHLLSSVSAYYYTPAQAIFVGTLVGLGACMVALAGTRRAEDLLLNLGGLFAALVALVPTSRGSDFKTAARACQQLAAGKAPNGLDCPTVRALEATARANVQNNIFALLVLGALALLAALLVHLLTARRAPQGGGGVRAPFWWSFAALGVFLVLMLVAYLAFLDWLIDNAHGLAALLLLLCILGVAAVNAVRHQALPRRAGGLLGRYRYGLVALALLAVAVVGAALWKTNVITLFWLEIAVALMFAVFWMVQTVEQMTSQPD